MERNFKDFKGQIIEDIKGNLYFVNGLVANSTTSEKMIVYTSLDNKHEVFTVSEHYFFGLSSSQSYRFFITNKNVPIPNDMKTFEDKQILERWGSTTMPKPNKLTFILIIIFIIYLLVGSAIAVYLKNFH